MTYNQKEWLHLKLGWMTFFSMHYRCNPWFPLLKYLTILYLTHYPVRIPLECIDPNEELLIVFQLLLFIFLNDVIFYRVISTLSFTKEKICYFLLIVPCYLLFIVVHWQAGIFKTYCIYDSYFLSTYFWGFTSVIYQRKILLLSFSGPLLFRVVHGLAGIFKMYCIYDFYLLWTYFWGFTFLCQIYEWITKGFGKLDFWDYKFYIIILNMFLVGIGTSGEDNTFILNYPN